MGMRNMRANGYKAYVEPRYNVPQRPSNIDGNDVHCTYEQFGWQSEYEDSNEEAETPMTSEENDLDIDSQRMKRKQRYKMYEPNSDYKTLEFSIKIRFEGLKQFKECIQSYAILDDYIITQLQTTNDKIRARYVVGCVWRIYASWRRNDKTFKVKPLFDTLIFYKLLKNK